MPQELTCQEALGRLIYQVDKECFFEDFRNFIEEYHFDNKKFCRWEKTNDKARAFVELARFFFSSKKYQETISCAQCGLWLYNQLPKSERKLKMLRICSMIAARGYVLSGDSHCGIAYFIGTAQKMTECCCYTKKKKDIYQAYEDWAKAARICDENESYRQARMCWEYAVRTARELALGQKQLLVLATRYTYLALDCYRLKDYESEQNCYDAALLLRLQVQKELIDEEKTDNDINIAILYGNYADSYYICGEFQKGRRCYQNAEKILLHYFGGNPKQFAENLSRLYYEWAEKEKWASKDKNVAVSLYTKGISAYEPLYSNDRRDPLSQRFEYLALNLNGRGVVYYDCGAYQKEIKDCMSALQIRERMPFSAENILQTGILWRNIADCYDAMGQFEKAADCYNNARRTHGRYLSRIKKQPYDDEIAELLVCSGRIYDELGEFQRAIAAYTELIDAAGFDHLMPELAGNVALCYFRRGVSRCSIKEHCFSDAYHDFTNCLNMIPYISDEGLAGSIRGTVLKYRGNLLSFLGEEELAQKDFISAFQIGRIKSRK